MSDGREVAGASGDLRADAAGSRGKKTLLLIAAACVALLCVLVGQASGYTRYVTNFGGSGSGMGSMLLPGGIAVSPDGTRVYVADTENQRIDEFAAEGTFVRAWGWGVADGKSKLETCRPANAAEEENGEGGERECRKGQAGQGEGQLNEPTAVAVGKDGTVYAINRAKSDGRIQSFDTSGEEVAYAGILSPGYGEGEGEFTYPLPYSNDIVVGPDGRIYVGDEAPSGHRIVIFDPAAGTSEAVQIPEVEKLVAFAPFTVPATKVGTAEEEPAKERIWVASEYGTPYLFEITGEAGELEAQLVKRAGGEGRFDALAVYPETNNLLAESTEYNNGEEKTLVEYDANGAPLRKIAVPGMTPGNEPSAYGLAVDPKFQYENKYDPSEEGVIYVVNRFGSTVNVLAEATPGEAAVESVPAENVSSTGATLLARITPRGFDTHAYFEYGTTPSYGSTSPAPPGVDLGSGFTSKAVSTHLYGLAPDTTYHYRVVVSSSAGTKVSADATFTTFPVSGASSLPDGRAYEQVTTEKGTANIEGVFAARGGNGVAFQSFAPLPGSVSGALVTVYAGLRSPAGWHTYGASSPVEDTLGVTEAISSDLTKSISASEKNVTGNAPPGVNLYLRDNVTGAETLMTPYHRRRNGSYEMVGASADYSRIFFRSSSALTPDAPEPKNPEEGIRGLYEWHEGTLRDVGILPGATTPDPASIQSESFYGLHAVSEDGSKVIFLAESNPGAENGTNSNQLYARIDGNRSVQISAPEPGVEDKESAAQNVTFVGAATDGSAAFFKSNARLTADAYTGAGGDREPNLYRYDFGSGDLVDLTVARESTDEELGAAIGGVIVSANGRSAYFVAKGNLAAGGKSGLANLYRWTEGEGVRFVAGLRESDSLSDGVSHARVTADGSVLAFSSPIPLDPRYPGAEGNTEIYRYAAADGSLVCVSCTRYGNGSQSSAEITTVNSLSGGYGGNVLSSDGNRVFFQTYGALVPQDTNGRLDVYEWENGSVQLISPGTASTESTLIDASATGDDVYFTSENQLASTDQDGYIDIYDAKVGGGLPGPAEAAPPCEGQDCRPAAEAASPASPIGSRAVNGPGNKKAKHRHKKHRKHHKHKKQRKHAKHRKQQRSHGHPAVGKRG